MWYELRYGMFPPRVYIIKSRGRLEYRNPLREMQRTMTIEMKDGKIVIQKAVVG